jgi:hypothetical protein
VNEVKELLRNVKELVGIMKEQDAHIAKLEARLDQLTKYVKDLESRQERHNARGAGRKKDDEKMQLLRMTFKAKMEEGLSMAKIMEEMQISKSTFYRLKRYWELKE